MPGLFCHYHPKVQSVSNCNRCGHSLCDLCIRYLSNTVYCPQCSEIMRVKQPLQPTDKMTSPRGQPTYSPKLWTGYIKRIIFVLIIIVCVYYRNEIIGYLKPKLQPYLEKVNNKTNLLNTKGRDTTDAQIQIIARTLKVYKRLNGSYPAKLEDFLNDEQFTYKVETKRDVSCDIWGNKYEYTVQGSGFELRSYGPDGAGYNADDIVINEQE